MQLKEADMLTEISLLAPQSTAVSLAYSGFTVVSEHVLHTDLCSCDQSNIFCTCHTYITHVQIDSILHMQPWNTSRTSQTVISTHLAASHRLQAALPRIVTCSCPAGIYSMTLVRRLTDTTKLWTSGQHFRCIKLFVLPILLLHFSTAITSERWVLLWNVCISHICDRSPRKRLGRFLSGLPQHYSNLSIPRYNWA